jgi:hypothetical protein
MAQIREMRERLPGAPDREVTSIAELPTLAACPGAKLATS